MRGLRSFLSRFSFPSTKSLTFVNPFVNRWFKPEQLWINPDCGLKTRQWPETRASLSNMLNATKAFRAKYSKA